MKLFLVSTGEYSCHFETPRASSVFVVQADSPTDENVLAAVKKLAHITQYNEIEIVVQPLGSPVEHLV